MGLFDELKKAECLSEIITVAGKKFKVTGKTLNDTGKLTAMCRQKNGKLDGDKMDRVMLEACVSDPETGETMSADDWGKVPRHFTGPLMKVALELCGLDSDDIERTPKATGSTES